MRGFLARAGHALGRLTVSLGYGHGQSPYDDGLPQSVACLTSGPIVCAVEVDVSGTVCFTTEPALASFTTAPLPDVTLEDTEPLEAVVVETEPFAPVVETEPEAC